MAVASLVARVDAQVASFETAFKGAGQTIRQFEKQFGDSASNVAAQQDRLNKAFASFSGDKIIREASALAAAVQKVGGAARLTAGEQARVNAVVQEAIAKYQALGQSAPKALIDIEQATRRVAAASPIPPGGFLNQLLSGQFGASAKTASASVSGLATSFGGLGSVMGGLSVGVLVRDFLNTGSALSDLQAQTAITVRDLQRFDYAGKLVGVSLEQITKGVGQLQNRLGSMDKSALKGLDDLGLSLANIQTLDPGKQFETIASAIARVEDPSRRAAIAMDLFGRSGIDLLPLLRTELSAVGDEAERMGAVLSDSVVKAADDFDDSITRMTAGAKGFVGNAVLGPIIEGFNEIGRAVESFKNAYSDAFDFLGLDTRKLISDIKDLGTELDVLRGKSRQIGPLADLGPLPTLPSSPTKAPTVRVPTTTLEESEKIADAIKREMDLKRKLQQLDATTAREREATSKRVAAALKQIFDEAKQMDRAFANLTSSLVRYQVSQRGVLDLHLLLVPSYRTLSDVIGENAIEIGRNSAAFKAAADIQKQAFQDAADETRRVLDEASARLKQAKREQEQFLGGMASALGEIARNTDGAFGAALDEIANITAAYANAEQATIAFKNAQTAAGKAVAVAMGVAAVAQATSSKNRGAAIGGGALAGAQAGLMFGPIGAGVGAAAGALVGFLRTMGQGRKAVEAFAETFVGGFDGMQKKLRQIGREDIWIQLTQKTGSGDKGAAEAAIQAATEALSDFDQKLQDSNAGISTLLGDISNIGGTLPASLQPYIDKLTEAGLLTNDNITLLKALSSEGELDWKKLEATAEKYGIKIESLGDRFQSAKISAGAQQIFDDFQLLIQSGADTNAVLEGMSDEISNLVKNSLKFGVAIPENFRPLIEKLRDSGKLIDENGEKLLDLSNLQFSDTIQTTLEKLNDTLKKFLDTLLKIPAAMDRIPNEVNIDLNVNTHAPSGFDFDFQGPQLKHGGIVRRPTLALIGEDGPEVVTPLDRGGFGASQQPIEVNVFLDGQLMAENQAPHLSRLLRRL